MTIYHGTNTEAALKIKEMGFIAQECSDYGIAVYFSDVKEWAQEYGNQVLEAKFTGKLLDLSNPEHFEIYKKTGNCIPRKFDALKDGHIIAVYNKRSISL